MKCPTCGQICRNDREFCALCGTSLKRRRVPGGWIALLVILILAGFAAAYLFGLKDPLHLLEKLRSAHPEEARAAAVETISAVPETASQEAEPMPMATARPDALWNDAAEIYARDRYTLALCRDGTVKLAGQSASPEFGFDLFDWTRIRQLISEDYFVAGLTEEGRVRLTGEVSGYEQAARWTDVDRLYFDGDSLLENIAYGQATPFMVMYNKSKNIDPNSSTDMDHTSWMRSSGHRDNILYGLKSTDKTKWKSVGIGMVFFNGNYYYYWAQEFSAYDATPVAKRTDRVQTTFSVGVTSEVYSRLQSRGLLNGGNDIGSGSSGGSGGGQSNGPVRGEWKNDGRGWWFSLSDGSYAQNCWLKSGGNWYAFGEDGYMLTGWKAIEGSWYYFHSDGHMASSEWMDGYWLSGDGTWTYEGVGSWYSDGTGWWFADSSGWYPVNQWQKINGRWYYFDGSGYMVTNRTVDGYYLGPDGAMQ